MIQESAYKSMYISIHIYAIIINLKKCINYFNCSFITTIEIKEHFMAIQGLIKIDITIGSLEIQVLNGYN